MARPQSHYRDDQIVVAIIMFRQRAGYHSTGLHASTPSVCPIKELDEEVDERAFRMRMIWGPFNIQERPAAKPPSRLDRWLVIKVSSLHVACEHEYTSTTRTTDVETSDSPRNLEKCVASVVTALGIGQGLSPGAAFDT